MSRNIVIGAMSCCFLLLSTSLPAQDARSGDDPLKASLVLPKGMPSEKVQIRYMIAGFFGLASDSLKQQPGLQSYELSFPGDELKIVAYMPGCRSIALELSPTSPHTQPLRCVPLRSVTLKGQINQKGALVGKKVKVEAVLLADWVNYFFGISDGFVPEFTVGYSIPDESGAFKLLLPDFTQDAVAKRWPSQGEWMLKLREVDTDNLVGRLEPVVATTDPWAVPLRSSYPDVVLFNVETIE